MIKTSPSILDRSDEQLNRAEIQLVRTGSIERSRPLSVSMGGDRKPSTESVTHITRIRVEKDEENQGPMLLPKPF